MDMKWSDRALCRKAGIDPELFWPVATRGSVYEVQVAEAKSVCRRCSAVAECLSWALETGQQGIAGGMTEQERLRLRRPSVRTRTA